jgi:hypothetical protein
VADANGAQDAGVPGSELEGEAGVVDVGGVEEGARDGVEGARPIGPSGARDRGGGQGVDKLFPGVVLHCWIGFIVSVVI